MYLSKFTRRLVAPKHPKVSPTRWNDTRRERVMDPDTQNAQELRNLVKRAHWLSVVCFMEQVNPESLCLAPSLLETVEDELQQFSEFESLAVYASALSRFEGAHDDGDS